MKILCTAHCSYECSQYKYGPAKKVLNLRNSWYNEEMRGHFWRQQGSNHHILMQNFVFTNAFIWRQLLPTKLPICTGKTSNAMGHNFWWHQQMGISKTKYYTNASTDEEFLIFCKQCVSKLFQASSTWLWNNDAQVYLSQPAWIAIWHEKNGS